MKKIFVTLAAIAALSFNANAQYFVGGNVGIGFNGGKTTIDGTSSDNQSAVSFTIAPNVGYYFADNFLAGARVGVAYDKTTIPGAISDSEKSSCTWAIQPYARYRFGEWNRFGLWSEVNAGIQRQTGKTVTGSINDKDNPVFGWAINVLPVLTYSVNEHLTLETSLDFLTFGYEGTYTRDEDKTYEITDSSFSFGANSNDIFGSAVGQIKVGFTYKF